MLLDMLVFQTDGIHSHALVPRAAGPDSWGTLFGIDNPAQEKRKASSVTAFSTVVVSSGHLVSSPCSSCSYLDREI